MTITTEAALTELDLLSLIAYIYPKTRPEADCLIYTGDRSSAGYGRVHWQGSVFPVHRITYMATKGPIPPGLQIDHLCSIKPCCRPGHLEAVTPAENVRRGIEAIRSRPAINYCVWGHHRTPENRYIRPGEENTGGCPACVREQVQERSS